MKRRKYNKTPKKKKYYPEDAQLAEKNKTTANIELIEELISLHNIKGKYKFTQDAYGDLELFINTNDKRWRITVNWETGRIELYDYNFAGNRRQSMQWHLQRSYSNWWQCIDSLKTSHSMNGKDWKVNNASINM